MIKENVLGVVYMGSPGNGPLGKSVLGYCVVGIFVKLVQSNFRMKTSLCDPILRIDIKTKRDYFCRAPVPA